MSLTNESFGKYILLEKIATGGMAEVYLAKNPGIGISKFVAIKRILPQYSENENFIEMFKGEAKIAINLAHSNIVSIHEFGVEREQFYIVMDYVEGRNLRQILNKLKKNNVSLSIEQTVYIIKEVAAGLDHAHRCLDGSTGKPLNIIHRDMSPQNVMVSFEGEVKVVDFGIAKAETQLETTRAGELKGKFGYMSPEQAEGQPVDLRTDIFSLGIVLWEMLANDRLFIANNEINTLRKIRECQVPSLRKINPNIPQELERICSMALAKDRNLRYQTSAAFHRELNRFMNRQFPDFSPHDFSVFIKTLFASDILENRKRQIEYSQVEARPSPASAPAAIAQATAPSILSAQPPPTPIAADRGTMTRTQHDDASNSGAASVPDFAEAGRDKDSRRQRAEAEAKAKAKSEAEARARLESDDRARAESRMKAENEARAPGEKRPASPRMNAARESVRNLKAEEFSLAVDTGSWHRKPGAREGTFAGGTYAGNTAYNYSVSGRHPTRRPGSQRSSSRVGTMAILLLAFALMGGAAWALVDNRGFKQTTDKAIAMARKAIDKNWQPEGEGSTPPPPAASNLASTCEKANVRISSSPSGAPIWIDDRLHSDSTPTDVDLCEGPHAIRIQLPGYFAYSQQVNLAKGAPQALVNAVLRVEKVAWLDVDVTGGVADIYVDSQRVGENTSAIQGQAVMAERELIVKATRHDEPKAVYQEAKLTIHERQTGRVVFKIPDANAKKSGR